MSLSKDLNSQPTQVRVRKGEEAEERICECLNIQYGWNLKKASFSENARKKIDRWLPGKSGDIPVQVKGRATGEDILYCLYEPFYGIDNENTKPGRDAKGEFKIYICLSGETIRVVKVEAMRRIIAEVESEWVEGGCKRYFASEKHPGCEIRQHNDKWNGRPKVLCFLNVEAFDQGKDIQFYRMK